jgi:hypothetical protein
MPEYALIVAAIAIGCVFAILVYSGIVNGLFDSTAPPLNPPVFVPPVTTPELTYPTSLDEQACVDYIASLAP